MDRLTRLVALAVLLTGAAAQLGCRACGTCYDYSPPVADCHCNTCGTGRSGSAIMSGGYAGPDLPSEAATSVAKAPAKTTTR